MTVNTNPNFNIPVIRPWADSNSYSAPAYWIADQRPNQLSHSRAQRLGEQSFELFSGSIGWGAGLQSSRLVQSKGSNPVKVL